MANDLGLDRPRRSVVSLGVSFIALTVGIVVIGMLFMGSLRRTFETRSEKDFPGLDHLIHIDRDLFHAQHALTSGLTLDAGAKRIEAVEEYRSQIARTEDRWTR